MITVLLYSQVSHLMTLTSEGSWDFNQPEFVDFVKLVDGLQAFMSDDLTFQDLSTQQKVSSID